VVSLRFLGGVASVLRWCRFPGPNTFHGDLSSFYIFKGIQVGVLVTRTRAHSKFIGARGILPKKYLVLNQGG